ncbi:family 43 glycosylhydrolase [Clostridium sp. C105KSO13]|uniref:family 43 glycosylhydrolase n=1 Tax=Clostridium sp. C105KSO13 TaxID=1776045 RepID=UPI00074061BA|nr:family 43 glycosylhydrolase [Clostridium sp. C105KSO13]CUX25191.1 Glycosyl hydrolases family 43 [Clostridium sp. C105KSO13]
MKYYCNPINVPYRYQFNMDPRSQGRLQIDREAADPSMIQFKGKYYIFASMNLSVWMSEDMVNWESYALPENLPLYDYAPDVRVCGDYVYFSASRKGEICNYYRTKDIIRGPYEEIQGSFDFWDPNLFFDEDGKIYFYWGCSNVTPVWGVELESETMLPKTERKVVIEGNPYERGYERMGIDHCEFPRSEEEVEMMFQGFLKQSNMTEEQLPKVYAPQIRGMFTRMPFIEGPWMDKYEGRYYLQYACPGTEYNTYADGVYVSDSPLGPFVLAANNPFSYHPGGFMPGAGHGSTMWDKEENLWHTSTMRISVNHQFERRVGIWPSGFDKDGELFCNQNYGDWPIAVEEGKMDPWSEPKWYLLSYAKPARASSTAEGKGADKAVNEDAQNWWRAAGSKPGEWIEVDLEKVMDVRAVQINFADDDLPISSPGEIKGTATQPRYIEERNLRTRWKLEGSLDGKEYFVIEDKSKVETDLPHDFIVRENGLQVRYVRLTVIEIPYGVEPCISGLRIFGIGTGEKPDVPVFEVSRSEDELDLLVVVEGVRDAIGYNICWGHEKEKLYHSYQIYRSVRDVETGCDARINKRIGALVKGRNYFIRVDAYNENGITKGKVIRL